MLFAYCMLGGGIFLFTPPSVTGKLQLAYARVFRGPLETGHNFALAGRIPLVANTVDSVDYTRLMTMQQRLRNRVANLQAQLDEAHRQIDVLAGLRNVPELNRVGLQPAGIINHPGETQTILLINRGHEDGLAVGQFDRFGFLPSFAGYVAFFVNFRSDFGRDTGNLANQGVFGLVNDSGFEGQRRILSDGR